MTRTDIFKAYLAQLAADVSASGKFAGAGSDRAEAAARALLSGAGGMLEALLGDVKHIAGDGRDFATAAVGGFASRVVDDAIHTGVGKLFEAISVSLDKERREKRKTGRALMDAAKRMGR